MIGKVELNPMSQRVLEQQYLKKIRKCNENIAHVNEVMEKVHTDFENTQYGQRGYTVQKAEEILNGCLEHHKDERKHAIEVLNHQIRRGYIFE